MPYGNVLKHSCRKTISSGAIVKIIRSTTRKVSILIEVLEITEDCEIFNCVTLIFY